MASISDRFASKKQEIVAALSRPSDQYLDASPKGSVDDGVQELIEYLNNSSGLVTTSSCAGRIAVFLEGPPKTAKDENKTRGPSGTSAGGKGGGRWLFSSHAPIDLDGLTSEGEILRLLGFSSNSVIVTPSPHSKAQFVHFKFEPMILHILASSAEEAHRTLTAAAQAGFRESGISGLFDSRGRESTPMVAVRSSGLALDSIIGFRDPETLEITPMVSEQYLRTLLHVANDRFKVNEQRKERFTEAFRPRDEPQDSRREDGTKTDREKRRRPDRSVKRRSKAEALSIGNQRGSVSQGAEVAIWWPER